MKTRNYSKGFTETFNWYLKYNKVFTFTGGKLNKRKHAKVAKGFKPVDAKEAFFLFDSTGALVPCKHPNILEVVFRCKEGINFQIRQWAEGRADGTLPGIMFSNNLREKYKAYVDECVAIGFKVDEEARTFYIETIEEMYELLPWMVNAVEKQKVKYYANMG